MYSRTLIWPQMQYSGQSKMLIWKAFLLIFLSLCRPWSTGSTGESAVTEDCEPHDKEALLSFKSELFSVQTVLRSWTSNVSCCQWQGVTCAANATSVDGSSLRSVQQLDLSSMNLLGNLSPALGNMSKLEIINLSHNFFTGSIPSKLFDLQFLSLFDLSNNNFTGTLPTEFGATSMSLTYLNVSKNGLSGVSPSFTNCNSLQIVDMNLNSFSGPIPNPVCGKGSAITYLDFSNNNLSGLIPPALGNCSQLKVLKASNNILQGHIPRYLTALNLLNEFTLDYNSLSGSLSPAFANFSSLSILDLSNNNLNGVLPPEIGALQHLKELYLGYNYFSGEIPIELSNCSNLEVLFIRENCLNGSITLNFTDLSHLLVLDLSYNKFSGMIPPTLSRASGLTSLAIAGNELVGEIPGELGQLNNLMTLSLSGNFLSGNIPQELQGCLKLVALILSKNLFTKPMQAGITGFPNLQVFAIGNTKLTGPVPPWLRNCSKMQVLDLSWNHLTGDLPIWLGELNHMIYLDVSNNSLSGSIPLTLANIESLQHDDTNTSDLQPVSNTLFIKRKQNSNALQYNQVSAFPPSLLLSNNHLSGDIPPALGNLKKLVALELSNNQLTGAIPSSLSNASNLETLDLSSNKLVGLIPASLVELNFLSVFNVSYNQLTGPIPHAFQFGSFTNLSYIGNSGLCGAPLGQCPQAMSIARSHIVSKRKRLGRNAVLGIAMSLGFGLSTLLITIFMLNLKKRHMVHQDDADEDLKDNDHPQRFSGALSLKVELFHNEDLKQLSVADLLKATNDFDQSNIIGCGGFGLVFRATLADGCRVAVKRLVGDCFQMEREFEAEVQILGKAKHANLVSLQGYCKLGDDRLLIYSYMENGSLDYWLHEKYEGGYQLDWPTRLKIIQGAARGLGYLHQVCHPHIIHRDIKSSNILLDEKFEAHVADFGLARLMLPTDTHVTTELVGTLGYIPPEYGQAWIATLRGDIYSFGVVILEVLTRKRPVDVSRTKGVLDLVPWIRQMKAEDRATETFDAILWDKGYEEEMLEVFEVACLCTNQNPQKRPNIEEVVMWLEQVGSKSLLYK